MFRYDVSSGGYLRTGDLGFIYKGELFICGRSKDLIIVRGSNHYPQDIERTAEKAEPRLRPGCSAAFSLVSSGTTQHTESVVFIAEVKQDAPDIRIDTTSLSQMAESLRRVIAADHGIALSSVCLLKMKTVPKTTSGKIARSWCRKAFLDR